MRSWEKPDARGDAARAATAARHPAAAGAPPQPRVVEDPDAVEELLRSQAARRSSRDQLSRSNPDFDAVSPQAGELDAAAVADLAARDPDAAARVLAAAARAFDPGLRAAARSAGRPAAPGQAAHAAPPTARAPAGW